MTKKKQQAELQPRIDEIEGSLNEVRIENEKHRANLSKVQGEHEEMKSRALALRNGKLEMESEKAQLITYLAKVRAAPSRRRPAPLPPASSTHISSTLPYLYTTCMSIPHRSTPPPPPMCRCAASPRR